MSPSVLNDVCVILGDSITQNSSAGTYSQRMCEYYERKLDVINRGYSGYNTEWCLPTLRRLLSSARTETEPRIRLLTIWLGANDAVRPGNLQHVPLDQYKSNLLEMIAMLQSPNTRFYSPLTKVVIITPPPFVPDSPQYTDRDFDLTSRYASACVEAATEAGVPFVDAHSGMIKAAGGKSADQLSPYYTDGLHLTTEGYGVVFDMLQTVIEHAYPQLASKTMASNMPNWDEYSRDVEVEDTMMRSQTAYHFQWSN